MASATEQRVESILRRMARLDDARELLAELNYDPANDPIPRHGWGEAARDALAEDPRIIAAHGDFQVIYCRLPGPKLLRTPERTAVNRLLQNHPYALFVFSNQDQSLWHFLNVKYDERLERRRLFRRITVGANERLRTATERMARLDLENIQPGLPRIPPLAIQSAHDDAFDVEPVTREFYRKYRQVFEEVEPRIEGLDSPERRRLFTQRLFNRLMFLAFVQKKGWLSFRGRTDYLDALWEARPSGRGADGGFYRDRLKLLFFEGLNVPRDLKGPRMRELIGDVPYLNGGLFEQEADDLDPAIVVPDACIGAILEDLFAPFNFTITESTPLDIEVAVDPEMLGKVFEELVTGRHETGSYYTPKPVVAFMCREALKGYLRESVPGEAPEALEAFVERHEAERLRHPEALLDALRRVRVCDPACGSGAYLLGMLHELLDLRTCLFAARSLDPLNVYDRKLEIIENNVYGVDIDPFAVNIARLRLWLSLAVDYEGSDPPPLPNLDFKIECGDSLLAPNPQDMGVLRHRLIPQLRDAKADYLRAHGEKRDHLRGKVEKLKAELAAWAHAQGPVKGFDWAVEFAEVFAEGGFDIVLANPPYVRQELLGRDYKQGGLKPVYPETYTSTADLYVYFFSRAHQLLRRHGMGCFISSNKWLRAGYGEKLRQHLLDGQGFRLVVDFGELPVFEAATFPAIFLWQKRPRGDTPTTWAVVKDLQACYQEGILEHITRTAQAVPASQFGAGKPRLATPSSADRRARMEASGPRLREVVDSRICFGIKTGLNEAFIIDRATRDRLVTADRKSAAILKPLLVGDDVRRYELHFRERYLIWTYTGVPIKQYPGVLAHLRTWQREAEIRQDQGDHWWELRTCNYYEAFRQPKIVQPDIGKETRFAMDLEGYFTSNTAYIIPGEDWYLLAVLNSTSAFEYLKGTCSVLGDEAQGGRLRFFGQNLETLPVPNAPPSERASVGRSAQEAQRLHTQRRQRVERFLREIGVDPARSSSRNPLEEPWKMTSEQFASRAAGQAQRVFADARDETAALTEQIAAVERELDARVAALYGVAVPGDARR